MAEFKSLADILGEERERAAQRRISPLIAEAPAAAPAPADPDRLFSAMLGERLERALHVLLREIATEVVGRELVLAPVEIDTIVARLRRRYAWDDDAVVDSSRLGDVRVICRDGEIDASLGRRLRAAIERAGE